MADRVQAVVARLVRILIYAVAYCLKIAVFIIVHFMHRSAARSAVSLLRANSAVSTRPAGLRAHTAHSASLHSPAQQTSKPSSAQPLFDPYTLSPRSTTSTAQPSPKFSSNTNTSTYSSPFTNGATASSPSSAFASDTTHFGFSDVPRADKERLVGEVFHRVANTYDVMNDLMSLGIHRIWKHRLLTLLAPTQHTRLLDVAGGTGDIAFRFIETVRSIPLSAYQRSASEGPAVTAAVTVCDINPSMLAVGKERASQYGYLSSGASTSSSRVDISFVEGNAEKLPFDNGSFDAYTIAFGLRNVTNTAAALSEARRVLKPGGVFHCLEFSKLSLPLLQQLYDAYSFNIIPVLGEVVASDKASYQYLVESISKWHSQETLAQLMTAAGMKGVRYENLTFGIAAIHTGYKV